MGRFLERRAYLRQIPKRRLTNVGRPLVPSSPWIRHAVCPRFAVVSFVNSIIRHSPPPMLAKSLIDEVDRLLKLGTLSQREIAARLKVSRGTVSAIASGRRGLHGRESTGDDAATHAPLSPPVRCPRCGYRVYMPCLVCRSRDYRKRQAAMQFAAAPPRLRSHPIPPDVCGRRDPMTRHSTEMPTPPIASLIAMRGMSAALQPLALPAAVAI